MLSGIQNGNVTGLTGFGASAHLVLKMIRFRYPESRVIVFARGEKERSFAIELGAVWAGDITDKPPFKADAIIDTTPVWKPVVKALENLVPGGKMVINAIRKENNDQDVLINLDYPTHLWMEKQIISVANVTREDVKSFLSIAAEMKLEPEIQVFNLENANEALLEIKNKKIKGAKVLKI